MKPALLVMAAGMGSRYGGLKQIDPVGPNGEAVIEYSLYDAARAGFGKIVFIVREQFKDLFDEKIGSKVKGVTDVEYAYQEMHKGIGSYKVPEGREKPWGTAHAILMAKDLIDTPFAAINADDFYGYGSFEVMAKYLCEPRQAGSYSMVGFPLKNTLSENGSVSRGICRMDEDGFMVDIVERTDISQAGGVITATLEDGSKLALPEDTMTSMNFWGFTPDLFDHIKEQFAEFLATKGGELKSEFYIPFVVDRLIAEKKASVKVVPTSENWFGVTYAEDKPLVQNCIKRLVDSGKYPASLWA
ncbi:MAG: NDP-sugar synthase [Phycisphaerae bacterium]